MEEEDISAQTFKFLQSLGALHDRLYKEVKKEKPNLQHALNLVVGMLHLCQSMREKISNTHCKAKGGLKFFVKLNAGMNEETAFRVEYQLRSLRTLLAQGHRYLTLMCQNTSNIENIAVTKLAPLVSSVQRCVHTISTLFPKET